MNPLKQLVNDQKKGIKKDITSICSAKGRGTSEAICVGWI